MEQILPDRNHFEFCFLMDGCDESHFLSLFHQLYKKKKKKSLHKTMESDASMAFFLLFSSLLCLAPSFLNDGQSSKPTTIENSLSFSLYSIFSSIPIPKGFVFGYKIHQYVCGRIG